jgi:N-acetylglucosaminyldiphosphoundecaprenol N-acetyl-beta-D-mannosaminyltransferase
MHEQYIKILGVKINLVDVNNVLDYIVESIKNNLNKKAILSYVNVHAINIAFSNYKFKSFINCSHLSFCDGYGIRMAASLLGLKKPTRMTPPDWIDELANVCIENNFSLYFLGSKGGVVQKAADKLTKRHPKLRIVGTHHGYFNKNRSSVDTNNVITKINNVQPEILLIGFGMPMQEYWIEENFSKIEAKVFLPVGAFFDYVSETNKRAPQLFSTLGLEWFFRLLVEPKRMWKRYILGNPMFLYRVFKEKVGVTKYDY